MDPGRPPQGLPPDKPEPTRARQAGERVGPAAAGGRNGGDAA